MKSRGYQQPQQGQYDPEESSVRSRRQHNLNEFNRPRVEPRPNSGYQCQQEGFFRDPNDCNAFYRCVGYGVNSQRLQRFDFRCPDGLHFSDALLVCTWPNSISPRCDESGDRSQSGSSPARRIAQQNQLNRNRRQNDSKLKPNSSNNNLYYQRPVRSSQYVRPVSSIGVSNRFNWPNYGQW